ncbi:MAG: hypothetical protein U0T74_11895 [Chitinophagales bacterium]
MKKVISIFLTIVILSQVFVNVGIGVYYHLNKAYISQRLCENRNNPKLHCNGHCYLSKQLKKAEEGEQKQAKNILKEKEELIVSNHQAVSPGYLPEYSTVKIRTAASSLYLCDRMHPLLKPPSA